MLSNTWIKFSTLCSLLYLIETDNNQFFNFKIHIHSWKGLFSLSFYHWFIFLYLLLQKHKYYSKIKNVFNNDNL